MMKTKNTTRLIAVLSVAMLLPLAACWPHLAKTPNPRPSTTKPPIAMASPAHGQPLGSTPHPALAGTVLLAIAIGLAAAAKRLVALRAAARATAHALGQLANPPRGQHPDALLGTISDSGGALGRMVGQAMPHRHTGAARWEQALVARGAAEIGKLENGLPWVSVMALMAALLGLACTAIGVMHALGHMASQSAFDSPALAARLSTAMMHTVVGLLGAGALKLAYYYLLSVKAQIVDDWEEATTQLVDLLYTDQPG